MDLTPQDIASVDDLTPGDVASIDAGVWAMMNKIKLPSGVYTFKNHEYQLEMMSCKARLICCMKGRQAGITQVFVFRTLHGLIFRRFPQGVLYLFPDTDTVQEFSKARFNPLISANRQAIGRYVKSYGKGTTDTTSLKRVYDSWLYLRGARLSQKISGVDESVKLKSIAIDCVIFDEMDHMSPEVLEKARGTMGHSTIKEEVYISNPLVPGEGIDKVFSKSDQRQWFRKCGCGEWTCAELSFPDCVKIRQDGTGYIGCNKCDKEVPIYAGPGTAEWVPAVRANTDYMWGYQWSQLTSAFNDPAEVLEAYSDPPEGNLADVIRLRLGLPYIAAEDRLVEAQIYECCGPEGMPFSHPGPCAMGVDVGIVKHIVIGVRSGNEQYTIIKVAHLSEWRDIHDLAKRFNVKSAVIDIRPYQDYVKLFQRQEPYQVFLCEYSTNPAYTRTWDMKRNIVKDYRTALFDETHRMVITPGMLTIPRFCPEIKEFAKQMCDAYKLLIKNKRTGQEEYRYEGEDDHYRNALNYFLLAASRSRTAKADGSSIRHTQTEVISEYVRV